MFDRVECKQFRGFWYALIGMRNVHMFALGSEVFVCTGDIV